MNIDDRIINEIVENVKDLSDITDAKSIKILTIYAELICNRALIYTNRTKFPEDMKYVIIDLLKLKFDSEKPSAEIQEIQSMSEAGRSINYGVSSVLQNKLNLLAQQQIDENKILLNRFRLVYKI